MKPSWNQFWMLAGVLATGLASNAAEQTITLRDWTGRGFAPEVISYDVPVPEREDSA